MLNPQNKIHEFALPQQSDRWEMLLENGPVEKIKERLLKVAYKMPGRK